MDQTTANLIMKLHNKQDRSEHAVTCAAGYHELRFSCIAHFQLSSAFLVMSRKSRLPNFLCFALQILHEPCAHAMQLNRRQFWSTRTPQSLLHFVDLLVRSLHQVGPYLSSSDGCYSQVPACTSPPS